ncbi:MAG: copper-binding protein [Parvularculaceae bacterium]|nr:copper-binding protein [Parvularculaceae bacterium]
MRLTVLAVALFASPAFAGHNHAPADKAAAMEHADHCGLPGGEGAITKLDVKKALVTISHDMIEALGWAKAETEIAASKKVDLAAFAVGDSVHFLMAAEKKSKVSVIVAMCATETNAHEACMASMHKVAMTLAAASGKDCGDAATTDHGSHH